MSSTEATASQLENTVVLIRPDSLDQVDRLQALARELRCSAVLVQGNRHPATPAVNADRPAEAKEDTRPAHSSGGCP